MQLFSGLAALAFIAVHLSMGWLHPADSVGRSRWLSLMGGAAVSYVFLHLLPELTGHQRALDGHAVIGATINSAAYLMALTGLVTFYGLEHHARRSRPRQRDVHAEDANRSVPAAGLNAPAFWVHALSFAAYNMLISFLLVHRERPGSLELVLYTVAMSLHFMASDYGLRLHYQHRYDRIARWLFAAAVAAGWLLGLWIQPSDVAVGLLFAFLAGGVVLNALKEELPGDRDTALLPFIGGVAGYALLLQFAH